MISCLEISNSSRGYHARFTTTYRTVSVYRVLQMRGGGYADVLPVLQVPDNKADAVPCERLRKLLHVKALSKSVILKRILSKNSLCLGKCSNALSGKRIVELGYCNLHNIQCSHVPNNTHQGILCIFRKYTGIRRVEC